MSFDDLDKNITAIKVVDFVYSFSSAECSLSLTAEYGASSAYMGRWFRLTFKDCIYFCCDNTSLMSVDRATEFISWGKHPERCCRKGSCRLFKQLLKREWNHEMMRIESDTFYHHYYFENAIRDRIELIAKNVEVKETQQTS